MDPCGISVNCYSRRFQSSDNEDEHCMRILDGFTNTTAIRYLQCLIQIHHLAMQLCLLLDNMSEVILCNLIMAGRNAKIGFHMVIKASRWASKLFQLSCFSHAHGPVISSFLTIKIRHDRRETLPFPLIVICQWERRILQSTTSTVEICVLGRFF